ncbi:hypothetical protein GZH53_16295 [Flavihumibacter sp. R14]|nr:hypothetical protein [Flavihumibacter soli]
MKNIFSTHYCKLVKEILIVIVLLSSAHYSFGQDKKDLTITLSSGILNSPYYQKANAKDFYGIDFGYQLGKRHILGVQYFAGKHNYYDDVLSNNPGSISSADGTNSRAEYRTFSVLYKRKIIDFASVSLVPGVGAGIMTHTRSYPYQDTNSSYTRISSWSDLVFPVSLDLNFKISKKWQTGLTSGFLIHPDYPILALHAGPKLSYTIK